MHATLSIGVHVVRHPLDEEQVLNLWGSALHWRRINHNAWGGQFGRWSL
jgi:hypothetical protein